MLFFLCSHHKPDFKQTGKFNGTLVNNLIPVCAELKLKKQNNFQSKLKKKNKTKQNTRMIVYFKTNKTTLSGASFLIHSLH